MKRKVTAIVLAGGTGSRMKTKAPKQFLKLAGKPIVIHTLNKFAESKCVSDIVVVCCRSHIKRLTGLIRKNSVKKIYKIVPGGKTRQESSFKGVNNCPPGTELVLIHDVVRPLVDAGIIKRTLDAAKRTGAATAAIKTTDTIVEINGRSVKNIPYRKSLKRVQTPQGFKYKIIMQAHKAALKKGIKNATDDSALVLAMGRPVKIVEGSSRNIKITDQMDLFLAERFICEKNF